MLWRGCQILRHCHWATFASRASTSSRQLPFASLRNPNTLVTRWTAAVAFKNHSNARHVKSNSITKDVISKAPDSATARRNSQRSKSEANYRGSRNRDIRDVLVQVEALFSLWKSGNLKEDHCRGPNASLLEILKDRDKVRKLVERLIQAHEPFSACRILLLAHHLGCKLKTNVYEIVAHCLAGCGQWTAIPFLVKLRKRHTGALTVRLLNWRTRAYIETNNFRWLETALDDFEQEKLQPTRRTYHLLISGHIRNRNLPKAKECLTKMEQAGFPIDPSTHALILSVYRSLGPDKSVQDRALASLPQLDAQAGTVVLNSLIQMCLDARDLDGAWGYLSMFGRPLAQLELPSKFGADSTQADGDLSQDHARPEIPTNGDLPNTILAPDIVTFTMLMNYMAKEHDLPRALLMLERMRDLKVEPDGQFVAALIRMHIAVGDLATATSIAASTCKDISATLPRFHDLGLPVTDRGPSDLLLHSVSPSTHIFNALLQGIQEKSGLKGTWIVRRIMQIVGIEPDAYTIEIIVAYLSKTEGVRPRELIRVLRTLSSSFVPTLRHVHVILSSVVRSETELVKSRGWRHKRQSKSRLNGRLSTVSDEFDPFAGIELPRRLSYRALIRPVLKILSNQRVRSDKATVSIRLRHDAVVKADIETAKDTFQTLLDRGMHPNQYHYAAIMEGFVKAGQIESAEEVLIKAINSGLIPNPVLYTIIIVGYARRGSPTQASRWFRDMVTRGIRPDIAVIDAMASAYFTAGAYAVARKVLLECWHHVGPLPDAMHEAGLRRLATEFRGMGSKHNYSGALRHKDRRRLRGKLRRLLQDFLQGRVPEATPGQQKEKVNSAVVNTPSP
ncbi:unnamed protein product [Somion occarium]